LVVAAVLAILAFFASQQASRNARTAEENFQLAATREIEALDEANVRATAEAVALAEADQRATAQAQTEVAVAAEATAEMVAEAEAAQRVIAEQQREEARRQAGIGLAFQAELQMIGAEPELAVLLGLEAIEEYPYSWQAEHALGQAMLDHKIILEVDHGGRYINDAALSPDGTRIMTIGDGLIKIWDAATGRQLLTFPVYDGDGRLFECALWSPSGDRILSGAMGGAFVWDAATGALLLDLSGHMFGYFSPDGTKIVTTRSLELLPSMVWDAGTGELLFELSSHTYGMNAFWSPDGTRILAGDGIVWDVETGQPILTLPQAIETRFTEPWSPDGRRIAIGGRETPLTIWDANSGQMMATSVVNTEALGLRWSPSGDRLLTFNRSPQGKAKVWDAPTAEELFRLPGVDWAEWSPDGQHIVGAGDGGEASVWDAGTGELTLSFPAHPSIGTVTLFPGNGDRIMTFGSDGYAKVWSIGTGLRPLGCQPSCAFSYVGGFASIPAWSPSGDQVGRSFFDWTATVWDVDTGEEIMSLYHEPHEPQAETYMPWPGVSVLAWSPSGDRLLTGGNDGSIMVWDAASGERVNLLFSGATSGMQLAAWSPDERHILAIPWDGLTELWDFEAGEILHTFGQQHEILAGAWSPDGSRFVTAGGSSSGGGATIWDPITGEGRLELFPDDFAFAVSAVDWSLDGERIVTTSADDLARIWDADSGHQLLSFPGVSAALWAAWSPSGDRILVAEPGSVKVFDAVSGAALVEYDARGKAYARWSPDGTSVAVSDFDGNLEIYPAWQSLDELITRAQECCIIRELRPEERTRFGLPQR
jgi:WD40 repeat protein